MWLLGHSALAYFVVKMIWAASAFIRKDSATKNKGSKTISIAQRLAFTPALLLFLLPFANWPDFMHLGILRAFTHNLFAIALVPLLPLGILIALRFVTRFEAVLLYTASATHMLGDCVFGSFFFVNPLSDAYLGPFQFNGPEDLLFESIIGIAFILAFAALEAKPLSTYLKMELSTPKMTLEAPLRAFLRRYGLFLVFLLYSLFALTQLLMNVYLQSTQELVRIAYLAIFAAYVFLLSYIFITSLSSKRCKNKT